MNEPEDLLRTVRLSSPSVEHENAMQALFAEARQQARRRPAPLLPTLLYALFGAAAACLTVVVSRALPVASETVYSIQSTPAVEALLTQVPGQTADRPALKFETSSPTNQQPP